MVCVIIEILPKESEKSGHMKQYTPASERQNDPRYIHMLLLYFIVARKDEIRMAEE